MDRKFQEHAPIGTDKAPACLSASRRVISIIDDDGAAVLLMSFIVATTEPFAPRSLRRQAGEAASRTALRFAKTFVPKKCTPPIITLHRDDGTAVDLDALTAREAFSAHGTLVDVSRTDANASCCYRIVVNAPRVTKLRCNGRATVKWPLLPTVATEFADGCTWRWGYADSDSDGTLSREQLFVPTHAQQLVGADLIVEVVPFREGTTTRTYGEATTCVVGDVYAAPLEVSPSILRAKAHRAGEGTSPARARADARSIRLVSFNILAPTYVTPEEVRAAPHLASDFRMQLLLEELIAIDGDVIALQECSPRVFADYLLPHLQRQGWDGRYDRKAGMDGCALFWRHETLELIALEAVALKDVAADEAGGGALIAAAAAAAGVPTAVLLEPILGKSSIVQLAALRLRRRGSSCAAAAAMDDDVFVVANTHLYYHPEGEATRTLQSALVLNAALKFAGDLTWDDSDHEHQPPALIVAGDLNATPETATVEFLVNGRVSMRHEQWAGSDRGAEVALAEAAALLEPQLDLEGLECAPQRRHGNLRVEYEARSWKGAGEGEEEAAVMLAVRVEEEEMTASSAGKVLAHSFHFTACHTIVPDPSSFALTTLALDFDGTLDWIFLESRRLRFDRIWCGFEESVLGDLTPSIPSLQFPSDHVAVVAEISLV